MEVAKIINDFFNLKKKINESCGYRGYIGFETKNGRRLISRFVKQDVLHNTEYLVLDENFYVLEGIDKEFKNKTPFEIIQGYFNNGSIPITNLEFFTDRQTAALWLIEDSNEDDDSAEYDEDE